MGRAGQAMTSTQQALHKCLIKVLTSEFPLQEQRTRGQAGVEARGCRWRPTSRGDGPCLRREPCFPSWQPSDLCPCGLSIQKGQEFRLKQEHLQVERQAHPYTCQGSAPPLQPLGTLIQALCQKKEDSLGPRRVSHHCTCSPVLGAGRRRVNVRGQSCPHGATEL